MSFIEIVGGNPLNGEVKIQGSKNAALPILAATVLIKGVTRLYNCPNIEDVTHMLNILESLGCKIKKQDNNCIVVDSTYLTSITVPDTYVKKMRSSIILLGSIIGRMHHVNISYPGGCSIGKRPIDLHLKALRLMKVKINEVDDSLYCDTKEIIGTDIHLAFPSVGATENILLAAVLAKGTTRILNAAKEPEINDLCNFLKSAGAKIQGVGTDHLKIEGVESLNGCEYTVSGDRIVAGTYMAMVAGTGGTVRLNDIDPNIVSSMINVLQEMGCKIECDKTSIQINATHRLSACPLIVTRPYPGFPTDLQSQLMTLCTICDGNSTIIENIFEDRFAIASELKKLGAQVAIDHRIASIHGVSELYGGEVYAKDLRGGAALVFAGLIARGLTRVMGVTYIERGYEDICKDLSLLGANIRYQKC